MAKIYRGLIHQHYEQGDVEIPWAFQDERFIDQSKGQWSYKGLCEIETGDFLVIYENNCPVWVCFAKPVYWSSELSNLLCVWPRDPNYKKHWVWRLNRLFAKECKAVLVKRKEWCNIK